MQKIFPDSSHQKKFPGYEIIAEIARGGMGVVYKARESNGRIVALKVLLKESLGNSTQKKRFYREAEATAILEHPNIVPIYTLKEKGESPYLAMKYIEGTNLQNFMESKNFSIQKGIEILRKVALALDYAHKNKIIHRDIKPQNILIDQQGEPYLTDFGLARFTDRISDLTQTQSNLGTPYYISPEQIKGSIRQVTKKSDIYSLGIILYQMLTSELPFQGDNLHELYYNIARGYPKLPDRKKYGALVDICYKAIDLKPRNRYRTASKMALDIRFYQKGKTDKISKISTSTYLQIHRKIHYCLIATIAFFLFLGIYLFWPKKKMNSVFHNSPRERMTKSKDYYQHRIKSMHKIKSWREKGIENYRRKNYQKALFYFQRAFQLKKYLKQNVREEISYLKTIYFSLAKMLHQKGERRESIFYLEKLKKLEPDKIHHIEIHIPKIAASFWVGKYKINPGEETTLIFQEGLKICFRGKKERFDIGNLKKLLPIKDFISYLKIVHYSDFDDRKAKALKKFSNLNELYIGQSKISDQALFDISSLKSLRSLSINRTDITGKGLKYLQNIRLRHLSIDGGKNLSLKYLSSKTLQKLYIADCCDLSRDGFDQLENLPSLVELRLRNCINLKDKDIKKISQISRLKKIRSKLFSEHLKSMAKMYFQDAKFRRACTS